MPCIEIDGLRLNMKRVGSGPALVLLHGFTGDATTWDDLAVRLASRFEVVAFDIIGHGESDSPPSVSRYQMDRCVDDLVSALRAIGHIDATWLGYSMGARTALQVAIHQPDAVNALILEGGSAGLSDPEERATRTSMDEALANQIERDGIEAFIDFWETIPLWNTQSVLPDRTLNLLRRQRLSNNEIGLANSLRGMGTGAQEPLHDRLDELDVPMLMITGALDKKFTAIAQDIVRQVRLAMHRSVLDCGHAVHLENPHAFEAAVCDFLEQIYPH